MEFEWDEEQRLSNLAKHGLDFADVREFGWDDARVEVDERFDHGEERFLALGYFRGRLHSVVFTKRDGVTRIVRFRKAKKREMRKFETGRA